MASNFVILITLIIAINTANGLTCYDCDSSKGAQCNFGLLSIVFPTKNCDESTDSGLLNTITGVLPKNCVKIVGVDKDGKEYVARTCAPSTGPINTCNAVAKTIQFTTGNEWDKIDCWTCNTDKCNSAGKLSTMTLLGFICAIFVFLFQ